MSTSLERVSLASSSPESELPYERRIESVIERATEIGKKWSSEKFSSRYTKYSQSVGWKLESAKQRTRDRVSIEVEGTNGQKVRLITSPSEGVVVLGIKNVLAQLWELSSNFKKNGVQEISTLSHCAEEVDASENRFNTLEIFFDEANEIKSDWGNEWLNVFNRIDESCHVYLHYKEYKSILLKELGEDAWRSAILFCIDKNLTLDQVRAKIKNARARNVNPILVFRDRDDLTDSREGDSSKELPSIGVLKKTAERLTSIRTQCEKFSEDQGKPVVAFCNARGGTIYSYGFSTIEAQVIPQFARFRNKTSGTPEQLHKKFTDELHSHPQWKSEPQIALLEVGQKWIKNRFLSYLVIPDTFSKIPSSNWRDTTYNKHSTFMVYAFDNGYPIVFLDGSQRDYPRSVENLELMMQKKYTNYDITKSTAGGYFWTINRKYMKLPSKKSRKSQLVIYNALSQGEQHFWDDRPLLLGQVGRHFEQYGPTEAVIKEGGLVVPISLKIHIAMRYFDIDDKKMNWYQRNFLNITKSNPKYFKYGSPEYIEHFRKWVPYQTDSTGTALLDKKGYPLVRHDIPVVAEISAWYDNFIEVEDPEPVAQTK